MNAPHLSPGWANPARHPPSVNCESEQWRPVHEMDGRVEVSNLGRLRQLIPSTRRAVGVFEPISNAQGYRYLHTRVHGRCVRLSVHGLVMREFAGAKPPGTQVAHLNGNPSDNSRRNLAYVTPAENTAHKYAHGTMGSKRHPCRTITRDEVRAIRQRDGSIRSTAAQFGVGARTVAAIRAGHSRADVSADPRLDPPDACRRGHLFTPENTHRSPGRSRICRSCRAEASRRHRAKKASIHIENELEALNYERTCEAH